MLRSLAVSISRQISAKNFSSTSETKVVENKNTSPLFQKLSAEFGDVYYLASIVNDEHVKYIEFEEWRSRIYILKTYGFCDSDCFKMISSYPLLLHIPPTDLNNSLRHWNSCAFGMDNLINLISSQPQLLEVEPKSIKSRIPYLGALFKSPISTITLVKSNPNIMIDNWEATINKIDYLLKVQRIEGRELLQSCALSKSLDLIMLRFEILEKCGLYKKPTRYAHKKNKYEKTKLKNPHLSEIIDINDESFAKKVAEITLEEYQVYEDLFEIPGKKGYKEGDDDDDDYVDDDE